MGRKIGKEVLAKQDKPFRNCVNIISLIELNDEFDYIEYEYENIIPEDILESIRSISKFCKRDKSDCTGCVLYGEDACDLLDAYPFAWNKYIKNSN